MGRLDELSPLRGLRRVRTLRLMEKGQFGRRLAELRRKRSLTQAQLAERTGFSVGYLANLEQGVSDPLYSTAAVIARALSVSLDAFLVEASEEFADVRPGSPGKFSDEQIAAMLADLAAGLSKTDVAGKHGCSISYVTRLASGERRPGARKPRRKKGG